MSLSLLFRFLGSKVPILICASSPSSSSEPLFFVRAVAAAARLLPEAPPSFCCWPLAALTDRETLFASPRFPEERLRRLSLSEFESDSEESEESDELSLLPSEELLPLSELLLLPVWASATKIPPPHQASHVHSPKETENREREHCRKKAHSHLLRAPSSAGPC